MVKKRPLPAATHKVVLATTIACFTVSHQAWSSDTDGEQLDKSTSVIVTGPQLKRTEDERSTAIISLTRMDMEIKGHANLYEALQGLTIATGEAQGELFANSYTPNAQSLNLRGFGPGRQLVLINGRRMANYPTPYNNTDSFFNFAAVPTSAVERVDILTDGASAIYGSDAIAGVINIVLRKDIDGFEISARVGDTKDGGGESFQLNGATGWLKRGFNANIGFEWDRREPLFGKDRKELDSVFDGPNPSGLFERTILNYDNFTGNYIAPPSSTSCDAHPELSYEYHENRGYYCGRDAAGDETIRNYRDSKSIFGHVDLDIGNTTLSADLMYLTMRAKSNNFRMWWGADYLGNDGAGNWNGEFNYFQRVFSPKETGPQDVRYDENNLVFLVSLNGAFSRFDYQAAINYNRYTYDRYTPQFIFEEINNFFLGTNLNYQFGYPVIGSGDVPAGNIYTYFTPNQLSPLIGNQVEKNTSNVFSSSFELSGELMTLSTGPVQFFSVVEFNSQSYAINPDARSLNNEWFGGGFSGGRGDRDQFALGAEFYVPLIKESQLGNLDLTFATRFDDYRDDSNVGDAKTFMLGLEWRPQDNLLLRSSAGTSFRAPGLHMLFADESISTSIGVDFDQCVNVDGNSYEDCNNTLGYSEYSEFFNSEFQGNLDLKEEDGASYNFGIVYEPTENLYLSLDYHYIKLKNITKRLSGTEMLRWEAECNRGENFSTGAIVDPNSEFCQWVFNSIIRGSSDTNSDFDGDVISIQTPPFNLALRRQASIDSTLKYRLKTDNFGLFLFDVGYTHILKTEVQDDKTDPDTLDRNYRDSPLNPEIRTRTNASVAWNSDSWFSSLAMFRKGTSINFAGTARIHPWVVWNATLGYRLDRFTNIRMVVNNIDNEKPPYDSTYGVWPFFDRGQYDAVGTEFFLQVDHKF
ncbi:TonB-dependent receptor plug domain-containing protein [Pleionea sediminis]|uniref:TonB-dependent receptor plug domain-containing protein n=1 Tax=Pleionea sediminis TaxID=2569479 RepID=UPI0013DDA40E|nr:TonB-dependent receptor [Pleionea sediminis]